MSFFKNSLWSFASTAGIQFIGVITNIVLARLLYPEIFGVLGMAMVFAGAVVIAQEAGISSYIIYKSPLTKILISTSFWLNVSFAVVLFAILFASAGVIGSFYQETQVITVIRYIAIGSLLGGFFITARALYMREKNFKKIAVIDLSCEIVASVSAVILALTGYHLLAISARYVIRPTLQSVVYLVLRGKDVIGKFDWNAMKEIVPYSGNVLGSQSIAYINNNIDYLFVGRVFGSYTLGLYTLAWQWGSLVRFYIAGAIGKVAFAELSSLNNDLTVLKEKYLDITQRLAFIALPICFGISAVADPFILLFYGSEWVKSGLLLKILVLSGGISAIGSVGGQIFRAIGRPKIELLVSTITLVFAVVLFYIATRFSIIYVAFAEVIKIVILEITKFICIRKNIQVKWIELALVLYKSLLASLVMYGVVKMAQLLVDHVYITFGVSILIGLITYGLVSYAINKQMFLWAFSKVRKRK
ncbi:lipopolysaccharide biosynthesis protein [Aquibacillus koreensis]|uniref:Lipopolysaccharide biosynthesis protein n=1 Tax=Aquibacillus koreensis TaxID=279446 RepID=A0A9X3WM49_9BACI|nr:lipopolysaccharide biosynthesis protein [Aquibacillus koreensis]MCT2535118.1 lipopolysaccharide biosynthesis protein [Aquibacillus koreensis]MDC3419761.1 lipopolysaccharide biosynthesis protein [Aquibacillus koreensis]